MSAESLELFASETYAPPSAGEADVRTFDATAADALPAGVTMLEASAGTGKTYSIASIVLRLLVESEPALTIDRILIVTFTEAATAELRDRVRRRVRDALGLAERARREGAIPAGDPVGAHDAVARLLVGRALDDAAGAALPRVVDRLRGALAAFDDAPITTIHGFCHRVLRERAFDCGGELDAELLTDDAELLESVVRDFWACETARRPVPLVAALVTRARLSLATLRSLARRAVSHPESACVPALDALELADVDALLDERARLAREVAGRWATDGEADDLCALIDEARAAKVLSGTKWRADSLEKRARAVAAWVAGDHAHAPLPDELRYFAASSLHGAVNKGKEAPTHRLCAVIDALCEADDRVAGGARTEALRLQHDCVAHVRREMARRKRLLRTHGFDDLLRLVCAALRHEQRGPGLVEALRRSYGAALIDEFQDTDDVQWEIFRRAFADPQHRLVLIGDPKQSIYAFRGADLGSYLSAREAAARRRALDTNRRTDGALLEALHALWSAHPMPFAEPAIGWRPVRAHHATPRLRGAGAPLRVRLLRREGAFAPNAPARGGAAPVLTKERLWPRLPELVASDVARFLASGATIVERVGGQERPRPVRPADVAVLVRTNRQARDVQRALRRAEVPAVIHGAESVFASREARELMAVLAAVLEPASPALARAALATDLLGLPAAAELAVALADGAPMGAGDLLAAMDDDDARWDAWAERLRAWRAAWRGESEGRGSGTGGVMRLVRALCDDLALPARLLALTDGERRLTNLLHLAELLHAASTERALAPGAALAWLREQVANADEGRDDAARQLRLESDDEAARVVTVHSSKGLEYGAVWCPYLWDGKLLQQHDYAFPHVPVPGAPTPRAIDLQADRQSASVARLEDDRFAESLRLAYVAMTRARHQVTLWWGAVSDFEGSPLAWLLHGAAAEPDAASPRRALRDLGVKTLDDDALRARLDAIAARAPALIAVEDEDADAPPVRWAAPPRERAPLAARAWSRGAPLDDGWRLGSFTGLTRGAHAHRDGDEDAPEALDDARGAAPEEEGEVPLAAFPASAQAGLFFHEVLERHDPDAPDALPALVADRLRAYGFVRPSAPDRWSAPVTDVLRGVLDAPLAGTGAGTLRLRDVPLAQRLTELRFELPACGATDAALSPAALARAFREHPGGALEGAALARYADRIAGLGFRPLRGFLTGAIDLVARHDGRWWLLDYKSNRLGPRRADYAPDRLAQEMADAHYLLQYHLYAVALHRWLALRVADYDWDRDVGGACYVFLRGVGAGTGVFVDRPPRARIEALDRVLREGA